MMSACLSQCCGLVLCQRSFLWLPSSTCFDSPWLSFQWYGSLSSAPLASVSMAQQEVCNTFAHCPFRFTPTCPKCNRVLASGRESPSRGTGWLQASSKLPGCGRCPCPALTALCVGLWALCACVLLAVVCLCLCS